MLRLIIADDEKLTRDSLREYIPWEELGIGTVETAKNGLAALELAQRINPDIIITDVRMPKMDGIEFATKVRELFPEVRIIFLSGYSDKEYLKSAIKLNAVSYVEKPVNLNEMKITVKNTVELCRRESEKKEETEKLKRSLAESIPLLRQEITLELVKGNADAAILKEKYDHPVLKQSGGSLASAACILLNWDSSVEADTMDAIRRNIAGMLCDDTFGDSSIFMAGFSGNAEIALVSAANIDGLLAAILKKLILLSEGRFSVSIGAGFPVNGPERLQQSYAEAVKAARRQFYHGVNRLYLPENGEGQQYKISKNLYPDFLNFLKGDDRKGALDLVDRVTCQIFDANDPDTDHIKNIYFNLLLRIFEAARERNLIDPAVENEKSYIWQEIDEIKTLSGLSEYIRSNLEGIFTRKESKDAVRRKTYEVMKFIRDNYTNKKLSVQMIADNAYLSKTYLCSFFKKSTGKTLNEYITEIRIEKSKELLRENRVKLYEIATDIGFSDTNYFSALFKKYVGCTPSEFREKNYL